MEVCEKLNIEHELGPVEWKLIRNMRNLLIPFEEAATRLEGENYATISEVYPVLFDLKSKLEQVQILPTSCQHILKVVRNLTSELDKRFSRVHSPGTLNFDPVYLLATFLDSRYMLLLEGDFCELVKKELKMMVLSAMSFVNVVETSPNTSVSVSSDAHAISAYTGGLFDLV